MKSELCKKSQGGTPGKLLKELVAASGLEPLTYGL